MISAKAGAEFESIAEQSNSDAISDILCPCRYNPVPIMIISTRPINLTLKMNFTFLGKNILAVMIPHNQIINIYVGELSSTTLLNVGNGLGNTKITSNAIKAAKIIIVMRLIFLIPSLSNFSPIDLAFSYIIFLDF